MEKELTKQDILDLLARQAIEFDRRMKASEEKDDRRQIQFEKTKKDFDRRMKELSRQIGDLSHTWGRFAEEQIKPHAIKMFQERGIDIHYKSQHVEFEIEGKKYVEIDLLLINEKTAVIIEIKNTLRQRDVEKHLERMEKIHQNAPNQLKSKRLIGAVASNIVSLEVENYAIQAGFFVIKSLGEVAGISNSVNFEPKIWQS